MMAEHDGYRWQNDIKVLFDTIVAMFSKFSNGDENAIAKSRKMKRDMRNAYGGDILYLSAKPDYSDQLRRWTYIYTYLPRHVHLVYAALCTADTPELKESLKKLKEQPIVCCVGGGPNCDALGLCIFLKKVGCKGTLTKEVCVLDEYDDWRHTWADMKQQSPEGDQSWMPETEWVKCDLVKPFTDDSAEKLKKADIITVIKSLSSVAASSEETVKEICDRIMKMMKPNALLLFIDNAKSNAGELLLEARRELNGSSHKLVLHEEVMTANLTSSRRDIYSYEAEALIEYMEDQPVLKAGDNEMILIHRFE
ncbi:uncharacterized protein [Apostichopus japonicus]|uniref:uncharacterized protein n=1 Tax=Stichopus japonicus TaxID=307972 RepID=UPI003AB4A9C9